MAVTPRNVQASNERALQQMTVNLTTVVREGVNAGVLTLPRVGIEVTSLVKEKLSTPGRGRVYRGRRGRGDHRASAPGDPPAPDTGQYRASWAYTSTASVGSRYGTGTGQKWVEIGTPMQHGPALEFGSSSMEPRPHLRPVVAEYARTLGPRVSTAIVSGQKVAIGRLKPPA